MKMVPGLVHRTRNDLFIPELFGFHVGELIYIFETSILLCTDFFDRFCETELAYSVFVIDTAT